MLFAGQTTLEQRFVPRRDRLTAIDVLIAAEMPDLPGEIQLEVLDGISRQRLRLSKLRASSAPVGQIWDVRPGQPRERWLSFGFDPITDGRSRDLSFRLSYPEGVDRPGARLATLASFPATYPDGRMLVNGDPISGNLLFRLAAAGTRGAALAVAFENAARVQPVGSGTLAFPVAVGVVCAILAASLLTRLR
jgi:hypothetical protein